MFIAALLRTLKQSKCPLAGGWISKFLNIYAMKCYKVIEKTELPIHTT
jgi:hypothetical protein